MVGALVISVAICIKRSPTAQEFSVIIFTVSNSIQKPENIHSLFDVTERDVKGFTPSDKSPEDEDEDEPPELVPQTQRARNYKKCIIVICVLSIISCLWPITGLCLCIANFTSNKVQCLNNVWLFMNCVIVNSLNTIFTCIIGDLTQTWKIIEKDIIYTLPIISALHGFPGHELCVVFEDLRIYWLKICGLHFKLLLS